MEPGKRITALREEKGWTTNRLANQCGLSQSFLRSVELGERGITVASLELVCDALGVTLYAFFNCPEAGAAREDALAQGLARLTPSQRDRLAEFLNALLAP